MIIRPFLNSEFGASINYKNKLTEGTYFGTSTNRENDDLSLDHFGAVFVFNNKNTESPWSRVSVGINLHKIATYDQKAFVNGTNTNGIDQYFEYYADSLEQLYSIEHVYLNDFLLATQQWTKQQLKAKWLIETANDQNSNYKENKWIDPMKPNNFQTSSNAFLYQQVFESSSGFLSNACILDALFAMGGKQVLALIS